jgi:hypothetical protein
MPGVSRISKGSRRVRSIAPEYTNRDARREDVER